MSAPWGLKSAQKGFETLPERRFQHRTARSNHVHAEPVHRDRVARFDLAPADAGANGGVSAILRSFVVAEVCSAVDEMPNRQPRGELGRSAGMVCVIVGDDEVVDLLDARLLRGGKNPVGVTPVEARPPGIDEQRLAGWRDE